MSFRSLCANSIRFGNVRFPTTAYKMNNETLLDVVYDKVLNLFIGSWINCSNVYNQVYDRPIPVPPSAGYFIARKSPNTLFHNFV